MERKRIKLFIIFLVLIVLFLIGRLFTIGIIQSGKISEIVENQQTNSKFIAYKRGTIYDKNMIPLTDRGKEKLEFSNNKAVEVFARYPKNSIAEHIIGYTDSDGVGRSGIEKVYNYALSSNSKHKIKYTSDALGNPIGDIKQYDTPEDEPFSIKTTIDKNIQEICEKVADKYIKKGAIVVIDCKDSSVSALLSRPTYSQTEIEKYLSSKNGELVNRAFSPYNAGSIFKIITTAAALIKNPNYVNRVFYCDGKFSPDGLKYFNCNKYDGHKVLDLKTAFAKSCNCAFFETGLCTDADDICITARKLGLGNKVLKEDFGESCGNIPTKRIFNPYETLNISIGQGDIMITPVQCAYMTSIIANSGVKRDLKITDKIISSSGDILASFENTEKKQVIDSYVANEIKEMMRLCVLNGTGQLLSSSKVQCAGKTGSAETGISNGNSTEVHGWFTGFFPYENPKYAITVFQENGKSGAQSCCEPFLEIAENIQ